MKRFFAFSCFDHIGIFVSWDPATLTEIAYQADGTKVVYTLKSPADKAYYEKEVADLVAGGEWVELTQKPDLSAWGEYR